MWVLMAASRAQRYGVGLAVVVLLCAACTNASSQEGCLSDSECPFFQVCTGGACLCLTNDQCESGRYCNNFGACQVRPFCLGNQECAANEICNSADLSGGKCIPRVANGVAANCGSSVHCGLGSYCSIGEGSLIGVCAAGCRSTSDCALGDVCLKGQCVVGGCETCPPAPTPDSSYCAHGYLCTPKGSCELLEPQSAYDALCDRCVPGRGNQCANGLICLVDNESCACIDNKCYPTGASCNTSADCDIATCRTGYCTPACASTLDCPSGQDNRCSTIQLTCGSCTATSACTNGSPCYRGAEEDVGSCLCTPADCNSRNTEFRCRGGRCQSGCSSDTCSSDADMPCAEDIDCYTDYAALDGNFGTCRFRTHACTKASGVKCEDLGTGQAICEQF